MKSLAKLSIDSHKCVFETNDGETKLVWLKKSNYTFLLNVRNALISLYSNIGLHMKVVANYYYINSITLTFEHEGDAESLAELHTNMSELIYQLRCGADRIPINFDDLYSVYIKRFMFMSEMLSLPKFIPNLTLTPFADQYNKYRSIVESLCYDWLEYEDVKHTLNSDYTIHRRKVIPSSPCGIIPYETLKFGECYFIHKLCYIAYIKKGKILPKMIDNLIKQVMCRGTRTASVRHPKYLIQYIQEKIPVLGKLNKEFTPSLKPVLMLNQLEFENRNG